MHLVQGGKTTSLTKNGSPSQGVEAAYHCYCQLCQRSICHAKRQTDLIVSGWMDYRWCQRSIRHARLCGTASMTKCGCRKEVGSINLTVHWKMKEPINQREKTHLCDSFQISLSSTNLCNERIDFRPGVFLSVSMILGDFCLERIDLSPSTIRARGRPLLHSQDTISS